MYIEWKNVENTQHIGVTGLNHASLALDGYLEKHLQKTKSPMAIHISIAERQLWTAIPHL